MDSDEHAKEVKLFGLGPLLLGRYQRLSETFYSEDRRLAMARAGWAYSLSLIGTAAFYGCYVMIALSALVMNGGLVRQVLAEDFVRTAGSAPALSTTISATSGLRSERVLSLLIALEALRAAPEVLVKR